MHGERAGRTVRTDAERTEVHRAEVILGPAPQWDADHHALGRYLRDRDADIEQQGNFGESEQAQREGLSCFFGNQFTYPVHGFLIIVLLRCSDMAKPN